MLGVWEFHNGIDIAAEEGTETVSVRKRDEGDIGNMSVAEFCEKMKEEMEE